MIENGTGCSEFSIWKKCVSPKVKSVFISPQWESISEGKNEYRGKLWYLFLSDCASERAIQNSFVSPVFKVTRKMHFIADCWCCCKGTCQCILPTYSCCITKICVFFSGSDRYVLKRKTLLGESEKEGRRGNGMGKHVGVTCSTLHTCVT